jgi:hypothetical protein
MSAHRFAVLSPTSLGWPKLTLFDGMKARIHNNKKVGTAFADWNSIEGYQNLLHQYRIEQAQLHSLRKKSAMALF